MRLLGSHPNVGRWGAFTPETNPDTSARKATCLGSATSSISTCRLPQHKHEATSTTPRSLPLFQGPSPLKLHFLSQAKKRLIGEEHRVPSTVTLNKLPLPWPLVSSPWLALAAFSPRALQPMTNASLDHASGDTLLLLEADGDSEQLFWDTEVTDGCWGVSSA